MEVSILGSFAPFSHGTKNKNELEEALSGPSCSPGVNYRLWPTEHVFGTIEASGYDVEVSYSGSSVIWSQAGVLKKKLDFREEGDTVLHVVFAWFPVVNLNSVHTGESLQRLIERSVERGSGAHSANGGHKMKRLNQARRQALVIFLDGEARVCFQSGETLSIRVPFRIQRVWPLEIGLLVERIAEPDDFNTEPGDPGLPAFFTLLDPFIEFRGVSLPALYAPISGSRQRYVENTIVYAAYLNQDRRIVVTYDTFLKRHRIWRYTSRIEDSTGVPKSMQADSRQVDIMMEIDEDPSLQMRSDTVFKEIQSDIQDASPHSSVFVAHALNGSLMVCIMDKTSHKLSCYEIVGTQAAQLWTKSAYSAIAVNGTRKHQRDIVICNPGNHIAIWTGFGAEFVDCNIDLISFQEQQQAQQAIGTNSLPRPSAYPSRPSKPILQVIDLLDSVEDRLSLTLSNGRVLRVQFDFVPRSDPVRQCMAALSFALPVDLWNGVRHRYLMLNFCQDNRFLAVPAKDEWTNFVVTVLSYCNPRLDSPLTSTRLLPGAGLEFTQRGGVETPKAKVRSESNWNFLLNSTTHAANWDHLGFRGRERTLPTASTDPYLTLIGQAQRLATVEFSGPSTRRALRVDAFIKLMIVALHLVNEDWSLHVATRQDRKLIPLLTLLASMVQWRAWTDYYIRSDFTSQFPKCKHEVAMEGSPIPLDDFDFSPPSVFRWVYIVLSTKASTKSFPSLEALAALRGAENSFYTIRLTDIPCKQTNRVISLYNSLMGAHGSELVFVRTLFHELTSLQDLDYMPHGVSLPLKEALWRSRKEPHSLLTSDELAFIGREDLAEFRSRHQPGHYIASPALGTKEPQKRKHMHSICIEPGDEKSSSSAVNTGSAVTTVGSAAAAAAAQKKEPDTAVITGVDLSDSEITTLRFGADLRVAEAQKMLQSSQTLPIKVNEEFEVSEEEIKIIHQDVLQKIALRTLSLPVGRGMLTYGISAPFITQKLPIPPIQLAVKLVPMYGLTELDLSAMGGAGLLEWPQFHNGVAAGLRIPARSMGVNSSWMMYNRPDALDCTHGGFLLALGLTGHLRHLVRSNLLRYLTSGHEMVASGLLLGLACAYRGTMDTTVTKVLSVHVPALLPKSPTEIVRTSVLNHLSCVLGLGLIYMETSHRRMAEVMLSEIKPEQDSGASRTLVESHSLISGFSLGFILLGQGNTSAGLRDMRIVDVLLSYMPGGQERDHNQSHQRQGVDTEGTGARSLGIDVTASGAMVALGLMHLKTNNLAIAAKLDIPGTQFMLDYIKPDDLIVRIICRSLVMWGHILPSKEWIKGNIPKTLLGPDGDMPDSESARQSYFSLIAGSCFAVGLRFAGSGDETAYSTVLHYLDLFMQLDRSLEGKSYDEAITKSTLRVGLDTITMACSMVVAGSGRIDFLRRLRKLHGRVRGDVSYGSHMACHMALGLLFVGGGGYTLGTSNRCIAVLLCSLFPRLPTDPTDNRSHVQIFRHLWALAVEPRCLVTRDAVTGICCPVPVKIHLRPELIQAQIEMQARLMTSADRGPGGYVQDDHLMVMRKVQSERLPESVDPLKIEHFELATSVSVIETMSPCILPELTSIAKIEILGPRYWHTTLEIGQSAEELNRIWGKLESRSIVVKRHVGHLSYAEDPHGMRGIQARPFPRILRAIGGQDAGRQHQVYGSKRKKANSAYGALDTMTKSSISGHSTTFLGDEFDLTFLQDPLVASFVSHLCQYSEPEEECRGRSTAEKAKILAQRIKDETRAEYFTSVLYECLTMDKIEILTTHVWIYDITEQLNHRDLLSHATLWELLILDRYYSLTMLSASASVGGVRGARSVSKSSKSFAGSKSSRSRQQQQQQFPDWVPDLEDVDDDGSETLVRRGRISELMAKVKQRLDLYTVEKENFEDTRPRMDSEVEQYFNNGLFPSRQAESVQKSSKGKAKSSELSDNAGSKKKWSKGSSIRGTRKIPSVRTDWFKVWLEVYGIPVPDAIASIQNLLEAKLQRQLEQEQERSRPPHNYQYPRKRSISVPDGEDVQWQYQEPDLVGIWRDSELRSGQKIEDMEKNATSEDDDDGEGEEDTREGVSQKQQVLEQVLNIAFPGVSKVFFTYLIQTMRSCH